MYNTTLKLLTYGADQIQDGWLWAILNSATFNYIIVLHVHVVIFIISADKHLSDCSFTSNKLSQQLQCRLKEH